MKIIEPSAHIEELPENIYQRIDHAASVCYRRPVKPTVEEAMEFCRGMIARKHWMPLEFTTVHLIVERFSRTAISLTRSKYILTQLVGQNKIVATGSIRAFMEIDHEENLIKIFLSKQYPHFFDKNDGSCWGIRITQPNEIPWQHEHIAVRVICSRAISHQLVRHRPCAILQESQRYCRYDGERFDGEVTFIRPEWVDQSNLLRYGFEDDCLLSERRYFARLRHKLSPQEARGALINDAKTELLMYANIPEWQHILNDETMRCSPHADPEMQRIMKPLREEFKGRWPEQF